MKRFGLIGHPLGHSMSPFIHARIMEMAGVNGTYELFSIEPSRLRDEVPRLMRELDASTAPSRTRTRSRKCWARPSP